MTQTTVNYYATVIAVILQLDNRAVSEGRDHFVLNYTRLRGGCMQTVRANEGKYGLKTCWNVYCCTWTKFSSETCHDPQSTCSWDFTKMGKQLCELPLLWKWDRWTVVNTVTPEWPTLTVSDVMLTEHSKTDALLSETWQTVPLSCCLSWSTVASWTDLIL